MPDRLRSYTVILLTCYCTGLAGQTSVFQRIYGGLNESQEANSIAYDGSGGYVMAGTTWSFGAGNADVFLLRVNSDGDTIWSRAYGGAVGDIGFEVKKTNDGGYVVAGHSNSFGGADMYLIRTDANGDTLWTRIYRDADAGDVARSTCVVQHSDNGFIVAGYSGANGNPSSYDILVIRTDPSGNIIWSVTYGGGDGDECHAMDVTSDGAFVLAGFTKSYGAGARDVYVIKIDSTGNVVWAKTHGGFSDDAAHSIRTTSDDGFIVTGYTFSYGAGSMDTWLLKLDQSGDLQWAKSYGGTSLDRGFAVDQLPDEGYIIAGATHSFGNFNGDFYLIRTDNIGDTLWTMAYGEDLIPDEARAILLSGNGTMAVTGFTYTGTGPYRNCYLMKADILGNAGGCNKTPTATIVGSDTPQSGTGGVSGSGAIALGTSTLVSAATVVDSTLCEGVGIPESQTDRMEVKIYPNPFSQEAIVELKGISLEGHPATMQLVDITGRTVWTKKIVSHQLMLTRHSLASGMYIYLIQQSGRLINSGKIAIN